ncbi:glycosyltransferase [Pedobacter cryoconitis]|uniref:Glycosyl transferase family 1 domain-containing protein n=1 Tax=Pedobacter cryoconitis TaxID=188932 RepID=A0A7X0J2Y7_9SPHI|nr:glycosyltransferase [Pedobacter cryoconitis]MBB6499719.1 hypothetical protein [Pedobacter cryoconitis]
MNLKKTFRGIFKRKLKKNRGLITNLYLTGFDRKVLISYIRSPFLNANQFTHQNYVTSHIVAECFSEEGYNVDIVDYFNSDVILNYDEYAVIFGMGRNLEHSFYSADRSIPRIHFVTGAHHYLHNEMSLKSIGDFYKLSGLWLSNEANVLDENCYYSHFNADFVVILAHGNVLSDYRSRFKNKVYSLNNNILGTFAGYKPKSIENRNSNFLFLSGGKLITKGFHLVMEMARLRKDLNFYVVVPSINEVLEDYYSDVLKEQTNVFLYKNIRMDSEEMMHIIENCTYSIAPSYIDGLPGGTIEPMSAGLIPIVGKYCGFPQEKFIFELPSLDSDCLNETINELMQLDDSTYLAYSNAVKSYTLEHFSAIEVKKSLKGILATELSKF